MNVRNTCLLFIVAVVEIRLSEAYVKDFTNLKDRVGRGRKHKATRETTSDDAMTDCEREAEVPLKQLGMDGEPKTKSGAFGGLFLNKIKLIALAVVILILLLIIIVLAAVLGRERAKVKREITPDKEGEEKEIGPTSVGPTTPGAEPWWQIRLPDNVKPYHYDLTLHIDLTKPHFSGTVQIWINVSSPTPYILLHARYMNFTKVELQTFSGGQIPTKRHFEFEKNQFLVIELASSLDRGIYMTTVEFSGKFSSDLRGMYKASFKDKNGAESFFSATQFEPLRARKAFPCFDEPAMKATFNVTLVHDPGLIALSNMPIYQSNVKKGWKYDHFEKTPIMSTYLAAFAVGDFKYNQIKTDKDVVIRIYAREEVLDQADYALNASNQTMMYFEEFFGVPYTLPKSDGIALPAFGPSGMENWGLIKYRETVLLIKEGLTSASSKDLAAGIVSHEMAHQWFGNIVTMKWWTDLWLNEGFASYAGSLGVEYIHPEWNMMDQFVARTVQDALELDGLASSHAVRIPVIQDPQKILELFDAISYRKGGSILLMLHRFLGDTVFRDGLKIYLTKHAYGNADTDDLWNAMTEAAGEDFDVGKMMNTFTLQMGYPVVSITKSTSKPGTYQAKQDRFLYYKDPTANYSTSPYGYKWVIPFSYFTGPSKTSSPPTNTMSKTIDKDPVEISWDGNGWIKGNIGQTGFYRVNYDDNNWNILVTQLKHNHKVFNVTDRAGLIDDSFNLARANLLNHTIVLRLSTYLIKEDDFVPLLAAMREFSTIIKNVPSTQPVYKYIQKFVEHLTKDQYNKLGIEDKGAYLEKLKRTILVKANCQAGVPSCLGNMTLMFRKWMDDPVNNGVPPDLKESVYHYGVKNGGEKEWNFVFEQFTNTKVVSDKKILLYAMAGAQEPWLIERYLNYALDSSKIGPEYMYYVMNYIAGSNEMGASIAWNFFQLKFAEISKVSGGPRRALGSYISFVSSRFSTDYQLQQLQDFINSVMKDEALPWSVKQAIEKVKVNIQWRKTHEKDVETWLMKFFNPQLPDFSNSK